MKNRLPNFRFQSVLCLFNPVLASMIVFLAVFGQSTANAADSTIFAFTLEADQASSCAGTGSDRAGFAICVLNADSSQLSIHAEHNIAPGDLLAGHVHNGAPCVDGPVAFNLGALTSPIDVNWALTPTDVQNLFDGNLYINLHTNANPNGEIRGQIVQQAKKFSFTLDESQINTTNFPRTFSQSNGVALCELNASATEFRIRLCHDVQPPFATGLHVHSAPFGAEGPVEFFIFDPVSPVDVTWAIDRQNLIWLFEKNLYLNLHSNVFVDGEIRGQIQQEELRFVFPLDGAQMGTGSAHQGFGMLTLNQDGTEVSVHVEHDIPLDSVMAGHIHLGSPGSTGPVLRTFPSAVSPINDTWAITDVEFEQLVAGQIYVDIATDAKPSGEIRGQAPGVTDTSLTGYYPSCDVAIDADQAAGCLGSGSGYTANGFVQLKKGGRQLNVAVTHTIPIDSVLAGHIHTGAECVVGPTTFGFTQATSPIKEIWYLSEADIMALMSDQLYINLHTLQFPAGAGELRGQILKNHNCCVVAGDADRSGMFNIGDVTFGIARIFSAGPAPVCLDEADANGDTMFNIADVTFGIARIFSGGPAPVCGVTGM